MPGTGATTMTKKARSLLFWNFFRGAAGISDRQVIRQMNNTISERISAMNKTKHSNRLIGTDEGCGGPDLDGAGGKEMTLEPNDRTNQSRQCHI